ncbi:MAG: phosphoribosylglycinamide formyltransferase [Nevskiaceae bacterium]|nr:MAG: phosphoribosylglycinamide formyltransferase [Nevskiaceae bacterium]TBR73963.1 MAG: phosphoribosylglycinamide formyltransferase [Nevskiaceae bacterium]
MKRARLAVLVSGRGRNLRALQAACAVGHIAADPVLVVSNDATAPALEFARQCGIPALALEHTAYASRPAFDAALATALRAVQPDIVALAGFMRVLGAAFVTEFEGRLLNIHPSLLPKYPGLHTHRRALTAGDHEHGATVHFVTAELDGGPRILQGVVAVKPDDDEDRLAARVLEDVELKIYPQVVAWMARGELRCLAGQAMFRGAPLAAPLGLDALEETFR